MKYQSISTSVLSVLFAGGCIINCGTAEQTPTDAGVNPIIDGNVVNDADESPDAGVNPRCTVASGTDLELVPVVSGLSSPVFVTAPSGDERLFVVEQDGLIRIVENDQLQATPFLDIQSTVRSTANEQGLLGLAFHPQYSTNGKFYVYYTATSPSGDAVISEYTVSGNEDVANAEGRILLTVDEPFTNHNGGMLAFGADGYLHIAVGDGGSANDPQGNGQNLNTHLGKLLRIDVDSATVPYGIPADNPFATGGGLPEIWAYGLRNPWRFSFDSQTNDLYIGDVGQGQLEEIDVLAGNVAGANYGWKIMEGTDCFQAANCDMTGKVLPAIEYPHTQGRNSITGGYVYRGTCIPDIDGWYFYGDFSSEQMYKFEFVGGVATNNEELTTIDSNNSLNGLASFGEDGFGELYVVSLINGSLFRIALKE